MIFMLPISVVSFLILADLSAVFVLGKLSLICLNDSIEIEFTYHAIHPFKLYNSVFLVYSQGYATITTM